MQIVKVRLFLLPVLVLACVATFLLSSPNTYAAVSPSDSIAALQKSCSVVHIHLNGGNAPTIACIKSLSSRQNNQAVNPNLGRDNTCFLADNIKITNNTGTLCFNGTGYLGVYITQVSHVYNVGGWEMWDLEYYSGHKYVKWIDPGHYTNTYGGLVTQICYNNDPVGTTSC